MFNRHDVFFGFQASASFCQLFERTTLRHNRVHKFAVQRFRVAPKRLKGDSIRGF
jgi:hypothetical protein